MKLKINQKAQDAIDFEQPFCWSSGGFWFDLTKGGYFKPEDVLKDKNQLSEVRKAIKLLQQLEEIYDQVSYEF